MTDAGARPTASGDLDRWGEEPSDRRPTGLRLARVHLRMSELGLARAELEAFAGRGELDEEALLDLAEVRWRTGDLAGAGEVANAYLGSGRRHPLALVIAAEAVASLGRPSEARRLAAAALDSLDGGLDPVFAGMPRSLIWPAEGEHLAAPDPGARSAAAEDEAALPRTIWADGLDAFDGALPDPADALDAGRDALKAGDLDEAAIRLGLAVRLLPALAPAVIDAIGQPASSQLALVRGDAYRLVGRELEAREAYAMALRGLARRRAAGATREAGVDDGTTPAE